MLVSRLQQLKRIQIVLGDKRPDKYTILQRADAGQRQMRRLRSWLGQDPESR